MLLYIHIPFCDSKCHYCAFHSYVDKFYLKESYMEALLVQLEFEITRFHLTPQSLETLFIGGGTPSTISAKLYAPLFAKLRPYLQENAEITIEANPNSATKEWLDGMYTLGANRISFGVQSFNKEKLRLLNRAHSPLQAQEAIMHAKEVGFENISLDLIYATLGDTKELLEKDLSTAFSLPINHLSAYALTIEEGTPFASKPQMSNERLELTTWLFEKIKAFGFEQYEISNFGTYQSRHNLGYWSYKEYIGLGSGAVGRCATERLYPNQHIESYIANPLDIQTESLLEDESKLEKIFLGLRSCVGVPKETLTQEEFKKATLLVHEKKLIFHNGTFYNPDYLLADEIALFIA